MRVVGARGLVLAVGRPVDTDVPRARPTLSLDHVRHVGPPDQETANLLDEMLETPADNGLQSTPLPNRKWPLTCDFVSSIVAPMSQERIYGGTSEIMKTIIARDLTGLRA